MRTDDTNKYPFFVSLLQHPGQDALENNTITSYPNNSHIWQTHHIYLPKALTAKNHAIFKYQLHDGIEILYITEGKGTLYMSDKEYILSQGDIALINPYQPHNFEFDLGACERLCIGFFPKFLLSNINLYPEPVNTFFKGQCHLVNLITHTDPLQPEIAELLENLIKICLIKSKCIELELHSKLLYIIAIILNNGYTAEPSNSTIVPSIIYDSLHYIDTHDYNEITTANIAKHIGYSDGHFCREFKRYFGTPFTTYMHEIKISAAKQLLISSPKIPIEKLAAELGYSNTTYFTQLFKQYVGISPNQFAQIHRG